MVISIAIQAYFAQMRRFFDRQGFDPSTKVVYGGDAEGPQRLLDQAMADKEMDRKGETDRANVRKKPFTYIFWTRSSPRNLIRRSIGLRDGAAGRGRKFKKTVSIAFDLTCVLVSNKANLIEDFAEAFSAEYQNLHTVPINLKFAYASEDFDKALNITMIQELGSEELVSYREGNLFAYTWSPSLYLNVASEFADTVLTPIRELVVDLYSPNGVPLASMDGNGHPLWRKHTASDGTVLTVPARPYVKKLGEGSPVNILSEGGEPVLTEDGTNIITE